jgi:hypothetical protein
MMLIEWFALPSSIGISALEPFAGPMPALTLPSDHSSRHKIAAFAADVTNSKQLKANPGRIRWPMRRLKKGRTPFAPGTGPFHIETAQV